MISPAAPGSITQLEYLLSITQLESQHIRTHTYVIICLFPYVFGTPWLCIHKNIHSLFLEGNVETLDVIICPRAYAGTKYDLPH